MKLTIIFLLICFATLSFPMSLTDAWNTSLSITSEILDNDFWSDEVHIKCTEYKAYYKKVVDNYYVVIKFELTNVMSSHNLDSFKIRIKNYSKSVSCIINSPDPVSIDECFYDGDYTCFYYKDSIVMLPSETREFIIVGVINDTNFDVVHSRICFHAMQRWWLRITPVCFDVKFRKDKVLPKNAVIKSNIDTNPDTLMWNDVPGHLEE